ncbi:hypothetical protein BJY00DRAFT_291589 [Aspergillus carlsbadensis]|nr:hypothetical protein BJY00DRAFT_291589 [Aspergillus carlsbadensis]
MMTPAGESPLLRLPNEILLLIFCESACLTDARSLAQTCAQLYGLFAVRRNRVDILRSAANVPKRPVCVMENIMRIPPHTWAFPSMVYEDIFILVEFKYGSPADLEPYMANNMCDLGLIQSCRTPTPTFDNGLQEFLIQFLELSHRCRGQFEPATERTLAGAAQLQREILDDLSRSSAVPSDLSSHAMVIALALHFFIVLRPFEVIDTTMVPLTEDEVFDEGSPALVLEADPTQVIPSGDAHQTLKRGNWRALRRGAGAPRPGYDIRATPDLMTAHIVEVCFQLLDTRDPRHWPSVLFAILLLYHALFDLNVNCPWLLGLALCYTNLKPQVDELARYYFISTEGGMLLSDRWNEAEYTALVNGDERAIRYARMLNELWLETDQNDWETRDVTQGLEGFPDKLDYFAFGCAI